MQKYLKKKLIGTGAYAVILSIIAVAAGSTAFAQFIQNGGNLVVDGVVTGVGVATMTIDTVGSGPITVDVTPKTRIIPPGKALGDFVPGDIVRVIAKIGSNPSAKVIQERSGSGYGFPGDLVFVRQGTVVSKGASSFTINTGVAVLTFDVTASTRFIKTSFAALSAGQKAQVIGNDSGSSFVARTVIRR
jgi:hypothetical protein